MPRQANGTYQAPAGTAAVSGQAISSSDYNTLTTDFGNEITNSLDRGGRGAMTANLPMGGNKINNLGVPVAGTDAATKDYVDAAMPPGALLDFAMQTAPTGWLACNGAAVSRTTYAALYNAIGTTFGIGDGSTTFNLPDFRGEFRRGWDNGRGVDTGRAFGSWQADAYLNHSHTASASSYDAGHTHTVPMRSQFSSLASAGGAVESSGSTVTNTGYANITTTVTVNNSTTGGVETRPRNVALLTCIKF